MKVDSVVTNKLPQPATKTLHTAYVLTESHNDVRLNMQKVLNDGIETEVTTELKLLLRNCAGPERGFFRCVSSKPAGKRGLSGINKKAMATSE